MRRLACWFLISLFVTAANAQTITVDVTDASAWTVVQDSDAVATFGFDYSPFGIPAAPGSDDTLGVRLEANLVDPGAAAAISITPNNLSLSGRFTVAVDVWMNYYADPEKNGTTEFAGLQVGFNPNGAPINGSGLFGSGDGDAAIDYRLFGDGTEIPFDSGQYLVESQNNVDAPYLDEWPGQEVPDAQFEFDPPNEFEIALDGSLAFAWHTFTAEVDTVAGEALLAIDDIEIGVVSPDFNGGQLNGNVALTYWDLFSSVAPVPDFAFGVFDNFRVDLIDVAVRGDLNGDGEVTVADIDILTEGLGTGSQDPLLDLNLDNTVDSADHDELIVGILNTWFGDANLDGEFNSGDFVVTFTAGKYETGAAASWGEGDWNADGNFDSSDFVAAFSGGGYEIGPRPTVAAVPEPTTGVLWAASTVPLLMRRRS